MWYQALGDKLKSTCIIRFSDSGTSSATHGLGNAVNAAFDQVVLTHVHPLTSNLERLLLVAQTCSAS